MQNYELMFILPGTLSEDEVPALVNKVKAVLEENGVEKLTISDMGKSRLAYPIKHIRYGYFSLAHFEAENNAIVIINGKLRLMSELLRVLLTKLEANKPVSNKISFGHMPTNSDDRVFEPRSEGRTEHYTKRVEVKKEETTVVDDIAANVAPKVKEVEEVKKPRAKKEDKRVKLDDIDKKLDEILDMELDKV
ncbi:MAG TPA: 30S ribosomal protein S6 [Candidatus Magasanikbacteria bacterium]|nr:30S ribosomal protein S6 [Candidatus Magasanikbacteria bacterium]